jgi:hypothetical protein
MCSPLARPDISLGVFGALGEKGGDRIRQFAHRGETLLSDVAGQVAKEALHQVEPRRRGRSKVHVEARALGEPSLHFVMLVHRVIVSDQVDVEIGGGLAVDGLEEGKPLLVA